MKNLKNWQTFNEKLHPDPISLWLEHWNLQFTKGPKNKGDVKSIDLFDAPKYVLDELSKLKKIYKEPGNLFYFDIDLDTNEKYIIVVIEGDEYLVYSEYINHFRYAFLLKNTKLIKNR